MQPHVQNLRTVPNRLMIVRAWRVGLAYLEGKNTKYPRPRKLTRQTISDLLLDEDYSLPGSKTQFDRAREGWPELMPVWPITLGMRPPWEDEPSLTPPEALTQPLTQAPLVKLLAIDQPQANLAAEPPPHRFGYTLSGPPHFSIGSPNDYMCKITGYRRDEMVGRAAPELFCPDQDRNTGGAGRRWFLLAKANPGERYSYGPIMMRAADGWMITVLEVIVFWSDRGEGCYVIDALISEQDDARYRTMHPGAQFPDPLDRQHFADHHAQRLEAENPVVSEPMRLEVTHPNGDKEILLARLQLPLFRRIALIAAGLFSTAILDASDGKLDGAIHWCQLLAAVAHHLA